MGAVWHNIAALPREQLFHFPADSFHNIADPVQVGACSTQAE